MNTFETIRDLMGIQAVSGHESRVAHYLYDKFEAMGLKPQIDVLGNCMAEIKGTNPEAPVVMVFAHMDQVGFLVRKIDDQGFIRLERVGGILEKVLPAASLQIETRDGKFIPAYVSVKTKHVTPPEEQNKVENYKDLFVDVGATSKKEVEDLGIEIGSQVVFEPKCQRLLGNRVYGTSPDNRKGCTVILEIAEELVKNPVGPTVWVCGSVQEEFSLSGASMAAKHIHPDIAISVDGALAADSPRMSEQGEVKLGGGPVLYRYNFHGRGTLNGTIAHPKMLKWAEEAAERANINVQRIAIVGALTDLTYVQYVDEGVACLDVGVPGRNGHTPVESFDLSDIEGAAKLIVEFVKGIKGKLDLRRW